MISWTCSWYLFMNLPFWEIRRVIYNTYLTEDTHLSSHNLMSIIIWSYQQKQWRNCISPMLTYTSKQVDKARGSNHFTNKDKPFNPYYIIHWIQLISSKVTPESKIVSTLHFIYSYEGITGNQDSLLVTLASTMFMRPLHAFHFEEIT